MEVKLAIQERSLSSPLSRNYDVPSFEEAFQEESLKKFYQEQDSASHVSSPQKENDMIEEFASPGLGSQDVLSSPLARYIKRMNEEFTLTNPSLDVELNPAINPEYNEISHNEHDMTYQQRQRAMMMDGHNYGRGFDKVVMNDPNDNGAKMLFNNGIHIQKSMSLPSNTSYLLNVTMAHPQESSPKPSIQELIKNKKVFTIQRNQRSPDLKAKTPSPSKMNTFSIPQQNNMQSFGQPLPQSSAMNITTSNLMFGYNGMEKVGNPSIFNYLVKNVNTNGNTNNNNMQRPIRTEDSMPEIKNFFQPQLRYPY